MTTNAELLNKWMSRLGQRGSVRVRADIVTEVNTFIQTLERRPFIPWFLEATQTITVNEGDTIASLEENFSIEREGTRPYYVLEGQVYYMKKLIFGAVYGYETTSTRPMVYSIQGKTFVFRPVADQTYEIILHYYARTDGGFVDDTEEISNPWLIEAADWISYGALKAVALGHIRNPQMAAEFAALEEQNRVLLYRFHEEREHRNQDYEVGGVSDGS